MKTAKKRNFPSPRERPLLWVFLCFSLLSFFYSVSGLPFPVNDVLVYNETGSMPRGIYLRIPASRIERGDIVLYDPPEEVAEFAYARGYTKSLKTRFLKRVGGIAGDEYQISGEGYFVVAGQYKGMVSTLDTLGRPLPAIEEGKHMVEKGDFLPVADASRSFDGRYTGTVPLSRIRGCFVPLLALW